MHWKKLGQIFVPDSTHPKLVSHAANPLAILLEGDVFRVFYSGRDINSRSSVGYVDIDIITHEIIYSHNEPVFVHGEDNSFYSHGVSIGNCYEVKGQRYILFMGWQCPENEHWRGDVGRLCVGSDLSLTLDSEVPFMASDVTDPVSLSYPWVVSEDGLYQMWYGSTVDWSSENGEMIHVINHASSIDGHDWVRDGLAVPFELGTAQAFSRPTVVKNTDASYSMWFSYRSGTGEKYRIGYAHSGNGDKWELQLEQAGINVSTDGWDSDMIEYPFVFDHKESRYMLYNGNDFGGTGFGLAVLTND